MTALDTKPSEGTRTIMNTKLYRNASEAPLWVRTVLLALIFTALSALVGYRYISEHSAISPQDEYVYIDAVDKAMHGEVTRQYSQTDEYARSLITCVGIEIYGPQGPACGIIVAPERSAQTLRKAPPAVTPVRPLKIIPLKAIQPLQFTRPSISLSLLS